MPPRPIDPAKAVLFRKRLSAWFRRSGRDLPWRRTRDPYRILVSETMLQQTQVSRVLDFYGRFLTRFPTLQQLAVASFAFEKRAALVDTNVARVIARVFAPRLTPRRPHDLKQIWALAESLLPRTGKAGWTHNQALMELGALVCTARVKRCGSCPVRALCLSRK